MEENAELSLIEVIFYEFYPNRYAAFKFSISTYAAALMEFAKKWDSKYPVIADIWRRNWTGIIPFFAFPEEIRKVIYTTNTIESANRQIRKIIKNKGVFPNDKSIQKIVYLALRNAAKKWTMPIRD